MSERSDEKTHIAEVVRDVLADHIWVPKKKGPPECWSANDNECGLTFTTGGQWRAHVAEIVAERLTAQEGRHYLRGDDCSCGFAAGLGATCRCIPPGVSS